MNDDHPTFAKSEPTEQTMISARQLVLQAALEDADHQVIALDHLNLYGIGLGSWTITINRVE